MEKCAECGSTNIQSRAWVKCDTLEFVEFCDDGEIWCDDCEDFVDIEDEGDLPNLINIED